jgi:hypothetical protein
MTISFDNTESDAVAWNVYRVFGMPQPRRELARSRVFASLAASLVTGYLALLLTLGADGPASQTILMPGAAALGVALLTFALVYHLRLLLEPRLLARQTRRLVKRGYFDRFLGGKEVSPRLEGLRIAFAEGETTLRWTAIQRWAETDTHVYLFWSENDIISLPKRAFANDVQLGEFLALVERYRTGIVAVSVPIAAGGSQNPWWHSRYGVESEAPDVNVNRRG